MCESYSVRLRLCLLIMEHQFYPNCFDQLTTHGIVAEDVVGYITDSPSPYLQNYVAQRGGYTPSVPWTPSIPGRVLPDPLPSVSPQGGPVMGYEPPRMQERLPRGDVYQTVPNEREINHVVKNEKNNTLHLLTTWITNIPKNRPYCSLRLR